MTPITFVSDLHLDFDPKGEEHLIHAYENFPGILIIAGDFSNDLVNYCFEHFLSTLFQINTSIEIIFIPGNHDYYGSTIAETHAFLAGLEKKYLRFRCLQSDPTFSGESFYTDFKVNIFGSTLWYPDVPDIWLLQNNINDFGQIKDFTPKNAIDYHVDHAKGLTVFDRSLLNIWVTHHLPSQKSISPRYKADRLNCYYLGDIEEKIKTLQPDIVIHGHTHTNCNYKIGKTTVLSNPKGYGSQNRQFDYYKHILWV